MSERIAQSESSLESQRVAHQQAMAAEQDTQAQEVKALRNEIAAYRGMAEERAAALSAELSVAKVAPPYAASIAAKSKVCSSMLCCTF